MILQKIMLNHKKKRKKILAENGYQLRPIVRKENCE